MIKSIRLLNFVPEKNAYVTMITLSTNKVFLINVSPYVLIENKMWNILRQTQNSGYKTLFSPHLAGYAAKYRFKYRNFVYGYDLEMKTGKHTFLS